jgi:dihydrofolate synthase/folylpolyglutamate synthase
MPYGNSEFKLDRMRILLERLGNPHRHGRIVHVAGTKGKGSTCHLLSAMLSHAGYRTGCYTSPHLMRIEERFAIDGVECGSDELWALVDRVAPVVAELDQEAVLSETVGPTFFEVTTAMAFCYFQQRNVDLTVLEVGLGGRLDSTNVCEPAVTVITSISFDHMRQLGNTLGAIAGEKAGIVKQGIPLVTGVTQREPREVIERIARERHAPIWQMGVDFDFVYEPPPDTASPPRVTITRHRGLAQDDRVPVTTQPLQLPALGEHQAANATLAWIVCELLESSGIQIPVDDRRQGLTQGRCPARIELIGRDPILIIDTAHNAASIGALVRVLAESFPQRPRTLILGATKEKDVAGMLHAMVPEFDRMICTAYQKNPRAMPADELMRHARRIAAAEGSVLDIDRCDTPAAALTRARETTSSDGLICATGSFFLAAEMKELLTRERSRE